MTFLPSSESSRYYKIPVRVATTANISLSGLQTVDTISLTTDDRILVKNQSDGYENGIYTVSSGVWTRSEDADQNAEVRSGMLILVREGSANGGKFFSLTTGDFVTLNTTNLVFSEVSAGGGSITGSGSSGAVTFWNGASSITQDSSNFFWDDSNNRLGIRTNSPVSPLHVQGDGYFSGSVGIGTSVPTNTLEVAGGVTISTSGEILRANTSANNAVFRFINTGGAANKKVWAFETDLINEKFIIAPNNDAITTYLSYPLVLGRTGNVGIGVNDTTYALRVASMLYVSTATSRVGIGTVPSYTLHVQSGSAGLAFDAANQAIGSTFGTGGGTNIYAEAPGSATGPTVMFGGSARGDADKNAIKFRVASTEYMRIDGDFTGHTLGNVGIGTATPAAKLHVHGDGYFYDNLRVDGYVYNYTLPVNAQTGTTYTLLDSDSGKTITLNNASAITLTVPSGLRPGFNCIIVQLGAGQVTIATSGTTVNNRQSHTKIAGQYGAATLVSYVSNTFVFSGDTAA